MKTLVIVESPAKGKKIQSYLGNGYQVKASFGHIRDLPAKKEDIPKKYAAEPWARLGIDVQRLSEALTMGNVLGFNGGTRSLP